MNGHVRRTFNLESLVEPDDAQSEIDQESERTYVEKVRLLPKKQLMRKLEEFDNLINAMGALFYASKRMQTQVPCLFQSWKGYVFEKRANKIHELISSGKITINSPNRSDLKSFSGTLMSRGAVGPNVLVEETIFPLSGTVSPDMRKMGSLNNYSRKTPHPDRIDLLNSPDENSISSSYRRRKRLR